MKKLLQRWLGIQELSDKVALLDKHITTPMVQFEPYIVEPTSVIPDEVLDTLYQPKESIIRGYEQP